MALGRAVDDEIFSKIKTAPTSGDQFLDAGASGMTLALAMEMCERLQSQEAPWDGEVYCLLPPRLWNQLLAYKQFNSSEYMGEDLPFKRATQTRSWNGVHWGLMQRKDFFPVPEANKADVFMWHKSAFGWADNKTIDPYIDWENSFGGYSYRLESEGAAVKILPEGVIRGRFTTNTAITPN
jgi:hypothetical protein